MDLLTLLTKLEVYDRHTTNTKTDGDTITWTGSITKVTVNSEDEFTNVIQLFLTHDGTDVTLHINHSKNNHLTNYKLTDISTLVIT